MRLVKATGFDYEAITEMTMPRIADLYAAVICVQIAETAPILDRLDTLAKLSHGNLLTTAYTSDLKKPQLFVKQIVDMLFGTAIGIGTDSEAKAKRRRGTNMGNPRELTMQKIRAKRGGGRQTGA